MAEIAPKETDRDGVRTLMRRGGQLIEVLPREEYEAVHLAGATSIPMSMISRNTADRLQWDKPVIVYAADCMDDRSARAAWRLARLGFTQVFRYTGGKADWLANGLPTEGKAARAKTAGDYANMDVPTCSPSERVGEIRKRVEPEGWDVSVVVNEALVVLGMLSQTDFLNADQKWTAEEAMERDPLTFRLDAPLTDLVQGMQDKRVNSALVTTSDGKLFGYLKREEVEIAAFKQKTEGV